MSKSTFKGAIYRGVGSVDIADIPYPECGDGDVIVKNLIAGICGAEVSAFYKGGDAQMIWKDSEFGHEMVSEVVEMGKDVKDIAIGDYVFPNMGQAKRDRMRMSTVGAHSEYIHIPQFEINYSAVKVDKGIPLTTSVLLEPFVVGTRAAKNTNPGPGKSAVVIGAGIIGMGAAIMYKWYGCDKVMVVDISDFRLENAKKFGLITCNPQTEDLKAKAIAEFGSSMCYSGEVCGAQLYVDATPTDDFLDYFSLLAGRNSIIAVAGTHRQPLSVDFLKVSYNNWYITGSGNGTYDELAVEVLEMMKSGKFDLSSLVTHQFKHEDIVDAIKQAGKPEEAQKVVVVY